jgi:hypothetical protein
VITSTNAPTTYINLDQPPYTVPGQDGDLCGDITNVPSGHNPQYVSLHVDTTCTPDANNQLLVPNCTAWRQPGANDACTDINDAYPGSPSKCRCDNDFSIPIKVETPTLGITKSANPTECDEPGCVNPKVEYTVVITNPAVVTSVELKKLTDDVGKDGSIDSTWDSNSSPTLAGICGGVTTLAPCGNEPNNCASGSSVTCKFSKEVTGDAGDMIDDEACISAETLPSPGSPLGPTCDDASVKINDVGPSAKVTKGAQADAICALIRYTAKVENLSMAESATLTSMCDNKFGDVTSGGSSHDPACTCTAAGGCDNSLVKATTCSVDQVLAASDGASGGSDEYSCTFDAYVCNFPHTNRLTATAYDNEGGMTQPFSAYTVQKVTVVEP